MDLEGQVAIVTGGGRGIGRGISLCLAGDGADIVIADLDLAAAENTAADLLAKGRKALVVEADVTNPAAVRTMVEKVRQAFGKVDILVNNAGVIGAPGRNEAPAARLVDWDVCYEVNLKATVICCEAVYPHMKEAGRGSIVNIASIAGRQPSALTAPYAASKAGCINWTQALAALLGPFNIRVNAVCPGLLWTPMWEGLATLVMANEPTLAALGGRGAFLKLVKRQVPLRREQTPEDIGYAVCFLASDRAKNITGQSLNVDGGMVMS